MVVVLSVKSIDILGVRIDSLTLQEAADLIVGFTSGSQPRQIVTANSEMIYAATRDEELRQLINSADLVTADGMGAVWAARILGDSLPERVAGYDLLHELCTRAAAQSLRLYLLGGRPGVAQLAASTLCNLYPGLQVVGIHHGYFKPHEEPQLLRSITAAQPHILFAALGVPRQEFWIARHRGDMSVPVAMGVGGSFDVLAGQTQRAPLWMQKAGLEWSYRLLKEPWRARRMLALPKFAALVWRKRLLGW